jgi:hypothetical protein
MRCSLIARSNQCDHSDESHWPTGENLEDAMTATRHALTGATYEAEGADSVRVVDGDKWGRFDRYGNWLEGEIIQCDQQMCIWLTGLVIVQERAT